MVQIPPAALPELFISLLFRFLPVLFVGVIVVALVAITYHNRDRETQAERRESNEKRKRSKYPDFEMDLNRNS